MARNTQPSLKTALADALKGLKQGELHTTQGESGDILAECPHNAGRIFQCMQSMVLDAGYIPLGIMLGGIVRPVIDRSPIDGCQTCKDAFWRGSVRSTDQRRGTTRKETAMAYTVKPFAQGRWQEDDGAYSGCKPGETPCAICGRPVKDPWPFTACVIDGGNAWGDDNSDPNDAGYMGWWPIGTTCHRKFKE